ncbi:CDP-alcohol phosphatidyltransferase family protein [Microbispora triticiradicis]|uniref:Phosphatidylinositol phosphate synthase n=3 Tax=Microbispora TaxID=2005 RepID=A0ABY3M2B2_9ACTN|nr:MULTISPECIES: CDP-alcohol phosphatidyltransferase family protein [Microbispora]RGA04412.1 CDP-alcohol phosphatidyltransferase family protein [Microbispora triticiradicis]TLP64109.1 CDP-alcohol phosphatidyltransferase family protein [Microbispora fusca]TYB64149.1 CDP-alcohol phosphatidyltransferase family protein [Microbispora tritici]
MLNILRPAVTRVMTPLGRALARRGISPDVITTVGTLGVVASALVFYPSGHLFAGSAVITFFVLADALDGVVARMTGKGSTWGAFLDSTLDRLGDASIFSGLILYFVLEDEPEIVLAAVALFCLVAGALVSYAKARAEGLGMTANVGIAERGERLVVVLVAAGLSGLGVPYILAAGLWLLAAASAVTVVQRMVHVYRQAVDR